MRYTQSKVFHLASTTLNDPEVQDFIKFMDAEGWTTNAGSDGEKLIEIAGKLCYRSFNTDDNMNIERVRNNDNKGYVGNILRSKHGSVLEHVYDTFALLNVSRTLTHEIVRHRHLNPSQESMRFVRTRDLGVHFPWLNDLSERMVLHDAIDNVMRYVENSVKKLSTELGVHKKSFKEKKKITSMLRGLIPHAVTTNIILTGNARSWRHVIAVRTSEHAEQEIRDVTYRIFLRLRERYPSIYQDARVERVDDQNVVRFDNESV